MMLARLQGARRMRWRRLQRWEEVEDASTLGVPRAPEACPDGELAVARPAVQGHHPVAMSRPVERQVR